MTGQCSPDFFAWQNKIAKQDFLLYEIGPFCHKMTVKLKFQKNIYWIIYWDSSSFDKVVCELDLLVQVGRVELQKIASIWMHYTCQSSHYSRLFKLKLVNGPFILKNHSNLKEHQCIMLQFWTIFYNLLQKNNASFDNCDVWGQQIKTQLK